MIAHVHDWFSVSKCGWFFRVLGAWALILSPAFGQAPQISQETKASAASKNSASKSVESVSDQTTAKGKYFVEGSVVEEETGTPIAKATLHFSFGGEVDPEKGYRKVMTDEKGHFRTEVPVGNVSVGLTALKPGFWLPLEKLNVSLSTSPEKPLATLRVEAKRSPVWQIQIVVANGIVDNDQFSATIIEIEDQKERSRLIDLDDSVGSPDTSNSYAMVSFDRESKGQVTQLGKSGKLLISLWGINTRGQNPSGEIKTLTTELLVDPTFDIARVKSVIPIPGSDQTQLVDENGAKAMVRKAKVTLHNGQPLLTFHLTRRNLPKQELTGKVVDSLGQPIPAVDISKISGYTTGSFEIPGVAKTESNGRFHLGVPLLNPKPGDYLKLSFTKDGFAGIDSREIPLSKEPGKPIDLGMISLVPGNTHPIRVVDHKDQPVAGATVSVRAEMDNFYAQTKLTLRTDENGRVVLRNLPVGLIQVHLFHGSQSENHSMVVSPIESENTEVKFHIKPARPNPIFKQADPLVLGQLVPELVVDRWTDGKQHKLTDFRGQVVVLDFWSMGWNPSVQGIPALKEVVAKYQPKGVVFLSIHSPEGDINQIKRFQKMLDWKALTGVDQGTTIFDGETIRRFGGQNPSTIIIDAEGKLAYHSRIPPKVTSSSDQEKTEKENKELAASLNIPWPLPAQDDAQSRSQRDKFHAAILGKEIEKVMAAKKK